MFSHRVLILIICFQARYPGEDGERTPVAGDAATANPNIVLATPQHGGHLAFFEGLAATSYWYFLPFWSCPDDLEMWSRAVDELLVGVLHSSPYICMYRRCTFC
ncbi:hypothetical protein POTOM_058444 [Populus tomentosa]|uniref:Uncharacterized protein n=1 Tax=Populus tomentosa TaxID=118781 RepID=A0A8X7XX06_POPTO|nr:hypothetical protein POTOM_058444 [Populus tomentosa]